jgi:hypothetical protein
MVGAVLLALSRIGVLIDSQVLEAIEQSSVDHPACQVK